MTEDDWRRFGWTMAFCFWAFVALIAIALTALEVGA